MMAPVTRALSSFLAPLARGASPEGGMILVGVRGSARKAMWVCLFSSPLEVGGRVAAQRVQWVIWARVFF